MHLILKVFVIVDITPLYGKSKFVKINKRSCFQKAKLIQKISKYVTACEIIVIL